MSDAAEKGLPHARGGVSIIAKVIVAQQLHLKIAEELKELLYNMSEIREELGKEKHAITKQVTRMELLLNELTTRVVELEKIGKETKRETVVAIEKAGDKLSKQTEDAATSAVKQELLQPIERFEKAGT